MNNNKGEIPQTYNETKGKRKTKPMNQIDVWKTCKDQKEKNIKEKKMQTHRGTKHKLWLSPNFQYDKWMRIPLKENKSCKHVLKGSDEPCALFT